MLDPPQCVLVAVPVTTCAACALLLLAAASVALVSLLHNAPNKSEPKTAAKDKTTKIKKKTALDKQRKTQCCITPTKIQPNELAICDVLCLSFNYGKWAERKSSGLFCRLFIDGIL